MTARLHLAAAAVAALAACNNPSAPAAGALLNEPNALAVFRGVTTQSGLDPASSIYPYRPYIAVANAGGNDLSIIDGITDALVPATTPLRGLVYPVPGRPVLLAAADLGDRNPDLLVAVTAGDLPWLGGSRLEVIRTWAADGAVVGSVDLGADILALAPLPFDPAAPGSVQVAAALAGERIAVVSFSRVAPPGDTTAIDVAGAQVVTSGPLGFQPLDLAVVPGDRTRVFAATRDPIPPFSILGVAEIDVQATPSLAGALNAHAPTRLVAAARLAEAIPLSTAFDQTAFTGQLPVDRVYAVLDESGCGLQASIACGLVAIDPVAGDLLPDPTPVGTMHAPFLAPIPLVGAAAVGASGPPAEPPDAAEPQYAGTYLRVAVTLAFRQTTAAAAVATMDGLLTFVDLGRWDVPSEQSVRANVKATVTSARPAGTTGTQWLVLQGAGGVVHHLDPAGLSAAVGVTAGYTPSVRWTVAREGILPNLQTRRAEAGNDGAPWLALQATGTSGVEAAVRLWDPTLGVRAGDTVVIDPTGLGTCGEFEATVADVAPPDATRPGGFVHLTYRVPTNASWDHCVNLMTGTGTPAPSPAPGLLATFRAGGYVLVRGTGTASVHVGRPDVGAPFVVAWQDETALASACPLPPSRPWTDPRAGSVPACDATCHEGCELLQRVRLARRASYVPEPPSDLTGPALAFTLALEAPTAPVPRDLALVIDTADGKAPFRVQATVGSPVDPRAVVPFDRSPWYGLSGIRFLVPFAGGIVLDGTPTLPSTQAAYTVH